MQISINENRENDITYSSIEIDSDKVCNNLDNLKKTPDS